MNECLPTGAVKACLRVGEAETSVPVDDALHEALFDMDLEAGPATIEAWFVNDAGERLSAAYLYARRN